MLSLRHKHVHEEAAITARTAMYRCISMQALNRLPKKRFDWKSDRTLIINSEGTYTCRDTTPNFR